MKGTIGSVTQTVAISLIIKAPLITKSNTTDQAYDLNTLAGTTTYTVLAFTLPTGISATIVYSDVSVSKPTAVTFSPTSR